MAVARRGFTARERDHSIDAARSTRRLDIDSEASANVAWSPATTGE
jgi:hypothetical protein